MKKTILLLAVSVLLVGCDIRMNNAKATQYCADHNTTLHSVTTMRVGMRIVCSDGHTINMSNALFSSITGKEVEKYLKKTK